MFGCREAQWRVKGLSFNERFCEEDESVFHENETVRMKTQPINEAIASRIMVWKQVPFVRLADVFCPVLYPIRITS